MTELRDCWFHCAAALFSQALSGQPTLEQGSAELSTPSSTEFLASFEGEIEGAISVYLSPETLHSHLFGDDADSISGWTELLREIADAASGELFARHRKRSELKSLKATPEKMPVGEPLQLRSGGGRWTLWLRDETSHHRAAETVTSPEMGRLGSKDHSPLSAQESGLFDIGLDATLRFGCREMPLGEVLNLGPGDVIELDRHVSDPVDLIVGDRIVAQGDVVLINGNFALRVISVATPKSRLESIRCLF